MMMVMENPESSAGETPAGHWSLLFGVRRSIRYHLRRERFLDGAHNLGALVTAISGSAAVASLLGRLDPALVTAAVTVTAVAGAAELVFRTAKTARLHNELAREFIALEKELVLAGEGLPEPRLHELQASRLDIEAREPPPLRVLDTLCHNELLRAMGYPPEQQVRVGFWQRAFAQLFDLREHRLTG